MKITQEVRNKFIALKFAKKVLPDLDLTEKEKDNLKNKITLCITKVKKV